MSETVEQNQRIEVTRTYLQMMHPSELKPARLDFESAGDRLHVEQVMYCPTSFYRYLYSEVGRNYQWLDRLAWSDEQTRAHLDQPQISIWVMMCNGAPAGFFELQGYPDSSVEIAYFGLLPDFIGRGLGKHFLTEAIEQAWSTNTTRVWLHTCTLDHPVALTNYIRRGFAPFKQDTYWMAIATDSTV
ncbi:GNAT family N-acetyltransferase [Oculatella sp. LEGE 06141]|uniref:GNAT family N-acetyltransferase n=1 Tax=Oculatella sp. LEGE 06141 TaxID=1828648 RepID=UPI0018801EBD|nr:GNAT family N-acetyltransferase [Oculatella sp. LEGE 06141]MBE9177187.1 GNAT family N-acetyltransferase [Oculatella sp. LEGE 06141]